MTNYIRQGILPRAVYENAENKALKVTIALLKKELQVVREELHNLKKEELEMRYILSDAEELYKIELNINRQTTKGNTEQCFTKQ